MTDEEVEHEIDVCFFNGEFWKIICTCMWEAWNEPTEGSAHLRWLVHAETEKLTSTRGEQRWAN